LGLAITKRFCEMLGGSISVASEIGHGSSFTIRLPRITEHAPEPAALHQVAEQPQGQVA
jgi:signal transduction histidine kinase